MPKKVERDKPLQKGYTTGVHASFAFKSALECFLLTGLKSLSKTNKMDNDDLDVTKGAELVVTISDSLEDLELNPLKHVPYEIGSLKLFAGVGVGVVTKEGLRPPKGFPAINPTPLEAIKNIYRRCDHVTRQNQTIYASISISNGEDLAKQTANAKVGVMGGLSILGTTGFVKPISADAYMDSIKTELNVAKANGYSQAVLTLGNSSFAHAKEHYDEVQIVEIGNFVYDALAIVSELGFDSAVFVCGIGKATKVMQGCKNTHNRFGSIDFVALKEQILKELEVEVDIESTKTVKGLTQQLNALGQVENFYSMVKNESEKVLSLWFEKLRVEVVIL
jgi:cobalt-precorrin-5B (C1)-methyltransferase